MSPRSLPRRAALALTAVVALGLAACNDDDESASDATSASTVGGAGSTDGSTDGTATSDAPTTSVQPAPTSPSSEPPADAATYTDALLSYLTTEGGAQLDPAQAGCAAPGWFEIIGLERLQASGQTPQAIAVGSFDVVALGLSDDEAGQLLAAIEECGVDLRELFLVGFGEGAPTECLDGEITDELVDDLLVSALTTAEPPDELLEELQRIGEACGLTTG